LQLVKPAAHDDWQRPREQTSGIGHAKPHPPQLVGLDSVSTQMPSQFRPLGQRSPASPCPVSAAVAESLAASNIVASPGPPSVDPVSFGDESPASPGTPGASPRPASKANASPFPASERSVSSALPPQPAGAKTPRNAATNARKQARFIAVTEPLFEAFSLENYMPDGTAPQAQPPDADALPVSKTRAKGSSFHGGCRHDPFRRRGDTMIAGWMADKESASLHPVEAAPESETRASRDAALDLARAASAGDVHATRRLLEGVAPRVLRVVRAVMGAKHPDVDDAAQLALIGFIQSLPSFRGECAPSHFAARIAVRTAGAVRRRAFARRSCQDDSVDLESMEAPPHEIAASRRRALVRGLLDQLPEEQAEALALRIVLGWSLKEIAMTTGAPLNTVRSRLRLAKEALRQRIAGDPVLAEALEPNGANP
jgi:RNA polymerase sigma factor (sigma-70 family)